MRWMLPLLIGCAAAHTETESESDSTPAARCPRPIFQSEVEVDLPVLSEASGLDRGATGALWTHNDSGDTARLFALHDDGTVHGELSLTGTSARDWEDLSAATLPELGAVLLVADTGDNNRVRDDVRLVVVAEPDPTSLPASAPALAHIALTYPGGPEDVEAVAVDPLDSSLWLVGKRTEDAPIYRASAGWWLQEAVTVEQVGSLPVGSDTLPGSPMVTAMDIDADHVLLRTYTGAWLFRRLGTTDVAAALSGEPCEVDAALEQGEAIALDGAGYWTLPETSPPPLVHYRLE